MAEFQTREQMMAARKVSERASLQSAIANGKPAITASRVTGGVRLVITRPIPTMRAAMDQHGFRLETGLANTYARVCATPADLTVVQDAFRSFFGR